MPLSVLCIMFLLNSIYFILAAYLVVESLRVKKWPSVVGRVISSRWEPGTTDEAISVHITYSYSVEEQTYIGDRVCVGGAVYLRLRTALATVARYPRGATVVHYDPLNPRNSILDTRIPWILVLILSAFGLSGVGMLGWKIVSSGML